MRKWTRRGLIFIGFVLAIVLLLSAVGVHMFHATPEWYQPRAASAIPAAQREQLARGAENKLIDAQNWAAELRADQVRTARAVESGAAPPATRASSSRLFVLSQDELNALFDKWSALYGWSNKYSEFVEDPALILRDGRLILAAKVKDLGAVASFQFRPQMDANGKLRLDLVKVTGGTLPLPNALWTGYRDQLAQSVRRHLPDWRQRARIDPSGAANESAMAAQMGRLFLNMAQNQPADPIIFLPLVERGQSVPVRVKDARVEDGALKLAAEPLTAEERAALLARIRSPIDLAAATPR
jgi:hypothetical protein